MTIEKRSECCGALLLKLETPMCSDCKEHCDVIEHDDIYIYYGVFNDVGLSENKTGSMEAKASVSDYGTAAHDPTETKP